MTTYYNNTPPPPPFAPHILASKHQFDLSSIFLLLIIHQQKAHNFRFNTQPCQSATSKAFSHNSFCFIANTILETLDSLPYCSCSDSDHCLDASFLNHRICSATLAASSVFPHPSSSIATEPLTYTYALLNASLDATHHYITLVGTLVLPYPSIPS